MQIYLIAYLYRGGSRFSGKGDLYVDMAVFRWSYLIFLKYPMEMKFFGPIEAKLFNFLMIIIKGGGGREGGLSGPPEPL